MKIKVEVPEEINEITEEFYNQPGMTEGEWYRFVHNIKEEEK